MRRHLITSVALLALGLPLSAQQPDTARPTGIAIITRYDPETRPAVSVRPFGGAAAIRAAVDSMSAIVRRDLEYSDRLTMLAAPAALATGRVDYKQWNALRVVYLVTGEATATAAGYELALTVHDVVYGRVRQAIQLRLPAADAPDFRMAVHAASDEVVRILTNRPGVAATRVAFTRQNPRAGGQSVTYDLLLVDSDGFGLRRISGSAGLIYSPDWSPDGRKLLYTQNTGGWRLLERDMATGSTRTINVGQASSINTPVYAPGGGRIAVSLWRETDMELYEYDIAQGCCLKRLTSARLEDQSATYSPDGRRMAFMSSRLGNPHIYLMSADGGAAQLLSPFVRGQRGYYTSPDWSPTGNRIAFHGHWNSRGTYQIMLADADRPGAQIRQLTSEGANEDPSWAPDGQHLVFTHAGVRGTAPGLYVVDTETGNRRPLLTGSEGYRLADWSPVLVKASSIMVNP